MTADTDQPTLAVTQADRDEALALRHVIARQLRAAGIAVEVKPPADVSAEVQAFARHRTTHEPRPAGDLREAAPAQRDIDAATTWWLINHEGDPPPNLVMAFAAHRAAPHTVTEADVERVAKAIYDATHAGLSNCYAWDDEWEPHQEAGRGRYYTEARAAIPAALATHSPAPMAGQVAIWSGEHRAYWRRGSRGEGANYTLNLDEVGIWSRADAIKLTSHCGPEKLIALHDRPASYPSTQEVQNDG